METKTPRDRLARVAWSKRLQLLASSSLAQVGAVRMMINLNEAMVDL